MYCQEDLVDNISASDVVAGLFIMQAEQKVRWHTKVNQQFLGQSVPKSHKCADCLQPKAWMTVENAHYYFKYSAASYGWHGYAMGKGLRALWSLFRWEI